MRWRNFLPSIGEASGGVATCGTRTAVCGSWPTFIGQALMMRPWRVGTRRAFSGT
jgi:hypothetical protein